MKRILVGLMALAAWAAEPAVRVWEEPLVVPTYQIGAPDLYPMFYSGRTYQGAKGMIYPYPFYDKITDVKKDQTYRAVYLENQYVKICVLPELGGRVFSAIDKTNNYDFVYRQHVIKPALIGMLGAWISGGMEWNVPHHHRASSYMEVDHRVESAADGSKTVWVGEIERRHRMKWLVGLTLRPDRSYLDLTFKVLNRTPLPNSMLCFTNIAVHTNKDYQVVFPPSTEFVTHHSKVQFSRWPVSDGTYGGVDFSGVDVSMWKNHPASNSMFAWNYEDDFVAGYDHGRKAGTLNVAEHETVPGKKFFAWGTGPSGQMWDQMLTDKDGPYLELMVGAYSDNQPDYSWIQPYEGRVFHQYLMPYRQAGAIKNATKEAAVNLDVKGSAAHVVFTATGAYPNARAVLSAGGKVVWEEKFAISPAQPFEKDVALAGGAAEGLRATLYSGTRELVSYQVAKPKGSPMPSPVKPPAAPKDIPTTEELYLAGLRLEQFHSPALEPDPFYEEALKRDPGDYRANTALGILYLKRGRFADAERLFETAVARATRNYTSPKDGEAYYYLGIARKYQGKADAWEPLYKSTWSYAWRTPAYHALAEISAARGDYSQALELARHALETNALDTGARNLEAALLRKLGRNAEAARVASATATVDPLDFRAGNELRLARPAGTPSALDALMRAEAESYVELAADYAAAGLWQDAALVLGRYTESAAGKRKPYPMVYYWLAWLADKQGNADAAGRYRQLAAKAPADYCFPYRLEEIAVLRSAIGHDAQDARAPYYLGNLLFDSQPQAAMREWERAASLDPAFPIAHRNLGLAYARLDRNLDKGIASLEKAVAGAKGNARLYYELDQLYEMAGASPRKRLDLMAANHETVVKRDDALGREVALMVQLGDYDKAINILGSHHFHIWEGGGPLNVHDLFMDAHLLRGQRLLAAGRAGEALKDFQTALEFPRNLEVGRPGRGGGRFAQVYYFIAAAQEADGSASEAKAGFARAAAARGAGADNQYYQGLACRKLGQADKAAGIFDSLISAGRKEIAAAGESGVDMFAKFGEKERAQTRLAQSHYSLGLGLLGAGKTDEARAEFAEALKLNVNHLGAQTQLAGLK